MAQLVFIDGTTMGNVASLRPSNTVGNSPENSLVIDDPSVSERHAHIRLEGDAFQIIAVDDRSAVRVNGRPVKKEALRHGDIVSIGSVSMLFSDEGPIEESPETPADAPSSVVQSRLRRFESADEVLTVFRSRDSLRRHLETLYKAGAVLSTTLDLDEAIEQLLNLLFEVFQPDRTFLLLYDESETLRVRGRRVSEQSRLTGFVRVSRSILSEAIERREAILTKDATQDHRFTLRESIVDQNIQSAMCVPLAKKDRILGVLYLDTLTATRTYESDDLNLMNGISTQASLAIENILHHHRTLSYSRTLETLGAVSRKISSYLSREVLLQEAGESACRLFDCKRGSILVADGDGLTVAWSNTIDPALRPTIRVRSGEPFCGKVFAENKAMLVADTAKLEGARGTPYESSSFLLVPIPARSDGIHPGERAVGVIAVTDKASAGVFTKDDEEFLTVFAAQLGIALQNATLFEKATVDALTRLRTRQFFFAQAEEIVAVHQQLGKPLSAILADLDDFKGINDQFGHQIGDEILIQAGELFRAKSGSALAARYGGEEIVVLLPGRGASQAAAVAEELRRAFDERSFGRSEPIRCTLSLGVAPLSKGDTAATLVRKADYAMYQVKRAGKNGVRIYEGPDVPPEMGSKILRLPEERKE